jgi:precorrin-6A/cobalt-precorrin-6A reductase
MPVSNLLILGGTSEAAKLAEAAVARFGKEMKVVTSLAGRTRFPRPLPGKVRIGGFGGSDGLAAFLAEQKVDGVIDATHPFAAIISRNGAKACKIAGVPRLMLSRPKWKEEKGDDWRRVIDLAAAAELLPSLSKRPFLTVGRQGLQPFAHCTEQHFVVRLLEKPQSALPLEDCEVVVGRPPFSVVDEVSLFEKYGIDALVTKESGGAVTESKIVAARRLKLPVVLIERPALPEGEKVETVNACLDWLETR